MGRAALHKGLDGVNAHGIVDAVAGRAPVSFTGEIYRVGHVLMGILGSLGALK